MTTAQKATIGAIITAAIAFGIFEARQAATARASAQRLQQQQTPLADQVRQLQHERDDATNQLALMAEELAKIKGNNTELLKLRGQVAVLHQQLADAEKSQVHQELTAAQEASPPSSMEDKFLLDTQHTRLAMKEILVAMRVYEGLYQKYPASFEQLKNEFDGETNIISRGTGNIGLDAFELVNAGAVDGTVSDTYPNLVTLREKVARSIPPAGWSRFYGFADGSVQQVDLPDGNFDAWEKAHAQFPPAQN